MSVLNWLDGRPVSAPMQARGLAYGDGLFETIAVRGAQVRFLSLHLQRLQAGCRRLALDLDDAALVREIALATASGVEGVLKISVVRRGAERGYAARPGAGSERLLQFFPQTVTDDFMHGVDAVLCLCRQRLSRQPVLAGLKHLNRLEQVLARAEWTDPQIAEGLMLDTGALVVEAVSSNVFCVRDGAVFTPALTHCGVAGVMRRVVMELLGVAVIEAALTLDDFYRADEVFITNSLRGIQPVVGLGCVGWQRGSVTIDLQNRLRQLLASGSVSAVPSP